MTNTDFANAYFNQAKSIHDEMVAHFSKKEWHLVVRRAQESCELILKGFLRLAGIEVPRLHDVSGLLLKERNRLPIILTQEMDRVISLSRHLRQERETSFYGDEEQELPPSMLYTEKDATESKNDIQWLLSLIPPHPIKRGRS